MNNIVRTIPFGSNHLSVDDRNLMLEMLNKLGMVQHQQAIDSNRIDIIQKQLLRANMTSNTQKEEYSSLKRKPSQTLLFLFDKISNVIDELDEDYNTLDVSDKIFHFGRLLTFLREAMDNLDESDISDKYLLRTAIIIHDLIKKLKAENIDSNQYGVIREGLKLLASGSVTKDDFVNLDNMLLDNGLDWIFGD